MRILELYLKAFGPFTEKRLDFEGGKPGLCVIHGPNEAGKSSALRAIHDLLYGIPPQSPDDFVHRYADMRVGARLRFADGEELAFLRKKGLKNTVRTYDSDAPAEEGRLGELTRLVPEALFRRFYGLDHEELAGGSRALLEDDGELGRSLYSAGLGAGNLRAILADLDKEADELFAPRAKKPRINERLAELDQIQKRIKQESLKPQAWLEAERVERAAAQRLARLEAELSARRAELNRLARVRRTLRPLALHRQARERQAALPEVPDLGPDFGTRLRELRDRRRRAQEAREAALERKQALEARREGLALRPELLAEREAITRLQAEWAVTSKEEADLPRREADLARLDQECATGLTGIDPKGRPETLETLRAAMGRGRRIRELHAEHAARVESVSTSSDALEQARERLERSERVLEEAGLPTDASRLRAAVQQAERLGPIDSSQSERRAEAAAIESQCERAFAGLGLWTGSADELEHAVIPDAVVLERFAAAETALAHRRERLREAAEQSAEDRRRVAEELATLRRVGTVPSEEDLARARRERDGLWSEIRRSIESHGSDSSRPSDASDTWDQERGSLLEGSRVDAFESSLGRADETVDRLRREADRVAQEAALVARLESLGAQEEARRSASETLETEVVNHDRAWAALWSPERIGAEIEPEGPAEMMGWRRRLERWIDLNEQRRAIRARVEQESRVRAEAREALRSALAALGVEAVVDPHERLAGILVSAREQLAHLDEQSERHRRRTVDRAAAEKDFEEARLRHLRSESLLARWREAWRVEVEGLCFSAEPRPDEALDRLDAIRELFEARRARDALAERISKMREDIEQFELRLARFLDRVARDLAAEGSPDQRMRALDARLLEAQREEDLRRELEHSLKECAEDLANTDRSLRSFGQQLDELRVRAGVESEEALDSIVRVWEHSIEVDQERARAEAQLSDNGDGLSVDQLEAEADGIDPDSLAGRISALAEQIELSTADRDRVRDEIGRAREALRRMDGSAEVASLAESAEEIRAALRREVDRYVLVRLSREILDQEIERYRREHQDPVLARACAILGRLTRGAYPELRADHDEAGRAQLVAVGSEGRPLRIDAMSSGTRDQLFLALRLATIEDSLERSEPIPLIADDILVHFDDDRSLATLGVLADLGERTQVLLFTHHSRVRDQAESLGARARVIELGGEG